MKNINTFLSLVCMLVLTQVVAQDATLKKRSMIEIALEKNGKIEKGNGYLLEFDLPLLKNKYRAIVLDKSLIGSEEKVILWFPMKSGGIASYEVDDISKLLFTNPTNNVALVRLGTLNATLAHPAAYSNTSVVQENRVTEFSLPFDEDKLKELKDNWEQSRMEK